MKISLPKFASIAEALSVKKKAKAAEDSIRSSKLLPAIERKTATRGK